MISVAFWEKYLRWDFFLYLYYMENSRDNYLNMISIFVCTIIYTWNIANMGFNNLHTYNSQTKKKSNENCTSIF